MAVQVIAASYTDGTAKTAAAAATILPAHVPTVLPAGYWQIGRMWRLTASGRISCAITTPGTCRFELRHQAITIWDSLAIPLNIVAKTDEMWHLEVLLTCRAVGSGTSANLIGMGKFLSEANINTATAAVGPGPGGCLVPFDAAPAVGTGFDSQIANALDFRHIQTVATGSITLHQFLIEQLTP